MSMTEERMQFLEEQIPYLAEAAFKQAYLQALASGSSVLISEEDALVEVFPDGSRKVLKQLKPRTPCTLGKHLVLK
jgi:hypothetical protein